MASRLALPLGMLVLFAAALFLAAPSAVAEPYMAVREGYKCSVCHVNRTGGGARTDYAAVYEATRMAAGTTFMGVGGPIGSAGEGLHGHTGSAVNVDADVRASLVDTNMNGKGTVQFNRPASCDSCHAGTPNGAGEGGGGQIATINLQFKAVPDVASIVYSVSAVPNAASRDVYGLVESLPLNGYIKAGTFKLPNGLNNTWDYPFQHTTQGGYQGLDGFETIYATGVEVGIEPGPFTVALSVTNPDKLNTNPLGQRYFLTASAVSRLGMIGFNYAQDPVSTTQTRTLSSGFLGASLGRVTLLGQIDQIQDVDPTVGMNVSQEARLGEVDLLLARGHNLKYQVEIRDPSVAHTKDVRDRQSLVYEPFLTSWLQWRVGYRKYAGPQSTTVDNNGEMYFVEMHLLY